MDHYHYGSIPYDEFNMTISSLNCTGNETSIKYCDWVGTAYICESYYNAAGIVCKGNSCTIISYDSFTNVLTIIGRGREFYLKVQWVGLIERAA